MTTGLSAVPTREGLDVPIGASAAAEHRVCGPIVRGKAIVRDDIPAMGGLPEGRIDAHDGGYLHLKKTGDIDRFDGVARPQSTHHHRHPPRQTFWPDSRTVTAAGGVCCFPDRPSVYPLPGS